MSIDRVWVGIDVSKSWFDVYVPLAQEAESRRFTNDSEGFCQLESFLPSGNICVCLEATGGFEKALCRRLAVLGLPVCLANPRLVSRFREALGIVHKTDRIDAALLCEFARATNPRLLELNSDARHELAQLTLALKDMEVALRQTQSRLRSPALVGAVRESLETYAESQTNIITRMGEQIQEVLDAHAELEKDLELLDTIPGIARTSALHILARLPSGSLLSARSLAAYAGLVPTRRESGTSVRSAGRVASSCNRRLRAALYMCALSARRYCPHLKAFGDRLENAGKRKKQVIVAVMRKLAHAIFAVLTTKNPYDGEKLCPEP